MFEHKHACVLACVCVCACAPPPARAKTQTMGASRLCPCCLKWGSVVLIELNEWSRTPLHLSDPAAPALPPSQIPALTPDAPAPSKEQLANGWPIKQGEGDRPSPLLSTCRSRDRACHTGSRSGKGPGDGESHVVVEKRCVCVNTSV